MATIPQIFDRDLLTQRRARTAKYARDADFMYAAVARDIGNRLALINRKFPVAVDLGTHTGRIAEMLEGLAQVDTVIQTDACAEMLTQSDNFPVCADEEYLPFALHSLDLVCSSLALHFVNDLPGSMAQILRSLRPDGLFMGALFGSGTLVELGQAFLYAETEINEGVRPRLAPLPDVREIGALLLRAGFTLPVSDLETIIVRYDSPLELLRDLRSMGATNILTERSRRPLLRGTLDRMCEIYRENFSDPDGRIRATFEIVHFAGWHPHESQQSPLAPGSAKMKLADALGSAAPDSETGSSDSGPGNRK